MKRNTTSKSVIVTLRLPAVLLDRADALLARLSLDERAVTIGRVSRSNVLRLAVLRGIERLERELPTAPESGGSRRKRALRD